MTIRRLSSRSLVHAAVASACLLVAVATARLEPLAIAVPFLVAVFLGLGAVDEPLLELQRDVTGTRVFEGETTTVSIIVRALTDIPLLEIAGPFPDGAVPISGTRDALLSIGRGEERRLTYSFRMGTRCRFELGPVRARMHAASAMASWETEAGGWVRCVVYPIPAPMRSRLVPRRTRVHAGSYPSRVAGEGIDFLDLRPFVAGDQTRRINWRATARRDRLVVNQFAAERNADVVLVLDVLSEGGPAGQSVLDMNARAAAALAGHFLREKNRVGYVELGHYVHWVLPGASRRQWFRILELLADLQVRERYLTFQLSSVPARLLPPGALVLGLSSLANPLWVKELTELKRRGYDVVVISPWGPDVVRASIPMTPEAAVALKIWELELETTVAELERVGVPCVPWRPGEPFDLAIRAVVREQRREGR